MALTQEQIAATPKALAGIRVVDFTWVRAGPWATRWLGENQVNFAVTDEHRIYIEDYIQNQIGSEALELGETRLITFALVQEAVEAAGQLNEKQLQNLSQYTSALT